jgi:hypothetical protein
MRAMIPRLNDMNAPAHASYSFLLGSIVAFVLFGVVPAGGLCAVTITAGIFPDIDGIFWSIKHRNEPNTTSFQHHLHYPTHWPITYLPVAIWAAVTVILGFFPIHFICLAIGLYSHLACDSMTAGDGINWGAPWSRRFINLFAARTDGYHGLYWAARYRKTIFFKTGNVAAIISMALLAWFAVLDSSDLAWNILGIIVLVVMIIKSHGHIDKKYEQEPPEGRYADYRALPEYRARLSPAMVRRMNEWNEMHGNSGKTEIK